MTKSNLEKFTHKYTTTHQRDSSKTVQSNSYFTSSPICNDETSDNLRNTTYEVDVPSIDNEWEDYAIKYG